MTTVTRPRRVQRVQSQGQVDRHSQSEGQGHAQGTRLCRSRAPTLCPGHCWRPLLEPVRQNWVPPQALLGQAAGLCVPRYHNTRARIPACMPHSLRSRQGSACEWVGDGREGFGRQRQGTRSMRYTEALQWTPASPTVQSRRRRPHIPVQMPLIMTPPHTTGRPPRRLCGLTGLQDPTGPGCTLCRA